MAVLTALLQDAACLKQDATGYWTSTFHVQQDYLMLLYDELDWAENGTSITKNNKCLRRKRKT